MSMESSMYEYLETPEEFALQISLDVKRQGWILQSYGPWTRYEQFRTEVVFILRWEYNIELTCIGWLDLYTDVSMSPSRKALIVEIVQDNWVQIWMRNILEILGGEVDFPKPKHQKFWQ